MTIEKIGKAIKSSIADAVGKKNQKKFYVS
jgi:hypothetical protein